MKNISEIILDKINLDKVIFLNGWVKKIKKLGSLVFFDIYDNSGSCQVVVEQDNSDFLKIIKLTKESCIKIVGKMVLRKNINPNIIGGNIEVILDNITVFSIAKNPPLLIQDETDALEEVRLKSRYLDLRRPINQKNIIFRSKFLLAIRNYLQSKNFIEIETPILSKQTPEGAKDYLVPIGHNNFFALPQSPQIYKQLLMVSGFLKYFQIARCFRNENLRLDRQPEFTQLDIEMSFINEAEIISLIEDMVKNILKETLSYDINIPFQKMTYDNAMNFYGTDKPDLRYEYLIFDCKDILKKSQSQIIEKGVSNNYEMKAIIIEKWLSSKKEIINIEKFAKDNGAKGLISIVYNDASIIEGTGKSFLEKNLIDKIFKINNIKNGTLFIVIDELKICLKSLGAVRIEAIRISKIPANEKLKFVWINKWPLFEYDEIQKKYNSSHHPFTAPFEDNIKDFSTNPSTAKARAYDIVLNGYELGGGSIRISDTEIQNKMFKTLGLSESEINEKFGFLINAFDYGVPPHGGIALGIERFLMILLETKTIRDVIAFPKNSAGIDLMMNSPSSIDENLLNELNLKINNGK